MQFGEWSIFLYISIDSYTIKVCYVIILEPGYYEENKFGIRIENIVRIVRAEPKYIMTDTKFLTFEDVTLVPIQSKMLVPSLLTRKEVANSVIFFW